MADSAIVRMLEDFFEKIDAHIRRVVPTMLPEVSIAAQDDGAVITNEHRILNFQGPGVIVSDDSVMRRTNIYIPGAPTTTTATVITSAAGAEKVFTLTSGSMASAPSNWETTGFSDSGWSNSVQMTASNSAFFSVVSGTQWVSDHTGGVTTPAGCLVRRTFSLPSGTLTSASLEINVDDDIGSDQSLYLNGVSLASHFIRSGSPIGSAVIDIPVGLLVTGGSNVLAVHVNDPNTGSTSPHAVSYRFTINFGATAGVGGGGQSPVVNLLASNVSLSPVDTYLDGPSVSLGAGTWLLLGSVNLQNNNATAGLLDAKLWDGTTVVSSGDTTPVANGGVNALTLMGVVTPTTTTTYKISAAAQRTSCNILAEQARNASGNNASYLIGWPI